MQRYNTLAAAGPAQPIAVNNAHAIAARTRWIDFDAAPARRPLHAPKRNVAFMGRQCAPTRSRCQVPDAESAPRRTPRVVLTGPSKACKPPLHRFEPDVEPRYNARFSTRRVFPMADTPAPARSGSKKPDSGKPDSGKLYIQTHGCQMNEYDSRKMEEVLAAE